MRRVGALLTVVTATWPLAVPALPFGDAPPAALGIVAWGAAIWMLLSVLSAILLARWLRARAFANERVSAVIRREDWEAALASERQPVE